MIALGPHPPSRRSMQCLPHVVSRILNWSGWQAWDPGMSKGTSRQLGSLCLRGHQGRIPRCPRDPLDSLGACVWRDTEDLGMSKGSSGQHGACAWRDTEGGSRDVQLILRTAWGPVSDGTPREDPGMSKGSSGQHGGLCLTGYQGRILGCPRDPPDTMGACVWRNTKGGSQDVQGILRTPWDPVSEGKPREDPRMSKGSSGQHGACVWEDTKGGSQDVHGILRTPWDPVSEGKPREDPRMSKGSSGPLWLHSRL